MVFLPRFLNDLAVLAAELPPVIPTVARGIARRLSIALSCEIDERRQQASESNTGIVLNINFCSPDGALGRDLAEDRCGPWWGLEGYDTG
ncbi:uncharacterized protein RMCC_3538 [Mycolicibacterium canariasense]|uniref:Uncharacterized protein n=1 Tax=Mycolicibacterium canariasense TaxID=228230 RepID=A0A117IAM4_MYCCR|nr:hypothetical protein [Mycolicibacterium canariasense]MCV7211136.1 hypothetical protein [Mycolicibacterium canariasense]GAS96572.1 uncharacterized protein RMCC_3538 [Mycolicibacterium canariasense]